MAMKKEFTQTQKNYIREGQNQDKMLREHIRKMVGPNKSKVMAKRHTIISGPPGVGKSYSTMEEIKNANANWIQFAAGASDSEMALSLAYAVMNLAPEDELIVLMDDADDVIFDNYSTANKFKFAMAKHDPFYAQAVNLVTQRAQYEKAGRTDLVSAIDRFMVPGSVGIHIPMDQVRFFVICNRNLEDSKQFRGKMWSAAEAIVDRVKYKRLDFEWKVSWGWLAFILDNSQPFDDYPLTKEQKYEICHWMWSNWERMRNQSYRTVEEMAEYMIDDPKNYQDVWENTFIKSDFKK
jgi:hypothetical protein